MRAFSDDERTRLRDVMDDLVPGASDLGAVEYVERLLSALDHEPPRIWAGPEGWLEIGPWERHAWAERIRDLQSVYRRTLAGDGTPPDRRVLHAHAVEAAYGDPAYGGNRDGAGWQRIAFPEPIFPPAREDA